MKKLFTLIYLVSFLMLGSSANSASWDKYYKPGQTPELSSCTAGVLTMEQQELVLEEINLIRAVHYLKPVTYNEAYDEPAREAALIMAANSVLSHTPDESFSCYSAIGRTGGEHTNLFISQYTGGMDVKCEESVYAWMSDYGSENVGHRRWIIDPFLKQVALGRADGPSAKNQGYTNSAMALYVIDRDNEHDVSNWDYDFVAYPFQNYKPRWVYCKTNTQYNWYYSSFTVIANKNNGYFGNKEGDVDYSNVSIKVTDEEGNEVPIANQFFDYGGYGVPNCLKWLPTKMEEDVKYTVEIKNVMVNGEPKDYSYFYKITEDDYQSIPGTPVLEFPDNNSTGIAANTPISWYHTNNTDRYHIQIAKDDNFANIVFEDETLKEEYYKPDTDFEKGSTYFWRVRSVNDVGWSEWSETWSFTVSEGDPNANIVLTEPTDGATISTLTPLMKWEEVAGASSYQIKIAPEKDVENYTDWYGFSKTVKQNSIIVDEAILSYDTQYWWIVRAKIGNKYTEWSEPWSFIVKSYCEIIVNLVAPKNGDKKQPLATVFEWEALEGADGYEIEVGSVETMLDENIIWSQYDIKGTTITIPDNYLDNSREYFWHIRAIKGGVEGPWSEVWSFHTTNNQNTVPQAYNPMDSTVNVPLDMEFKWSEIKDINDYTLEVYEGPNINESKIRIRENVSEPKFKTDGSVIKDKTQYCWRIKANRTGVNLPWSYLYHFTTDDKFPSGSVWEENISDVKVSAYPNPADEFVIFDLNIPDSDEIVITVYNVNGIVVNEVNLGYMTAGTHAIRIETTTLQSGTYYYTTTASDGIRRGKFVIMK